MASESRKQSSALDLFEHIKDEPFRYDLFDVLRYVEAAYGEKERLGESVKATEDPIFIRQQPSMAFAPATISRFIPNYKGQSEVFNFPYGVFGPNGPLPLHGDDTFSRFADVFHHRMISLLYRSWANTQPTIEMDRPESNKFDQYVGALAGKFIDEERIGDTSLQPKMFRAGLFNQQARSADGLETLISDYFQIDFYVDQYSSGWLVLNETDQFVLGQYGFANTLGENTCLGSKVYDCQHKFTITTTTLNLDQFKRLLPGTDAYQVLYDLITDYIGIAFEWDLVLKLKSSDTPTWSLGQEGRLGWTNWLGQGQPSQEITEVQLKSRSVMHYGLA